MKLSTGVAMVTLVLSGSAALAQQADVPPTGAQAVQPVPVVPTERPVTGTGAVAPAPVQETPRADPNRTGPDVVNGLEVPAMKNPAEGGR
jgi:hypothetical protein